MLAGGHLPEALREARLDVVVEVRPGEMGELRGLLRDRLDDLRVGVADVQDRDAGRKVDEQVPVDVLDHGAGRPSDHDRGRFRRRRDIGAVPFHDLAGLRSGRRHLDVRNLHGRTWGLASPWAY